MLKTKEPQFQFKKKTQNKTKRKRKKENKQRKPIIIGNLHWQNKMHKQTMSLYANVLLIVCNNANNIIDEDNRKRTRIILHLQVGLFMFIVTKYEKW